MRKLKYSLAWTALFTSLFLMGPTIVGSGEQASANSVIKISKDAIGKSKRISVPLNKSSVIDLPGEAHDILVANPAVADAITRTSSRIYIFAKQVGETNIFIFDSQGRQLLSIDLKIERDIKGLEENLRKFVPGSNIKVEIVNDNIILTGTVPTPQASAQTLQLTNAFLSGGEATTNQFQGGAALNTTGGNIIFNQEARQQSQIVNLLTIEGEDQVHLKVTVAEIQRTIVKQLGIDITSSGFSFGNIDIARFISDSPLGLGNPVSGNRIVGSYANGSGSERIDGLIRALDNAGVLKTLAEPSLTAISGVTASFSVGGELNIAGSRSGDAIDPIEGFLGTTFGTTTVEYGVSLTFTPVVLAPGRISLNIQTEVSEPTTLGASNQPSSLAIDRTTGATGFSGGTSVPGIRRRSASTTVELPSGGSMVLAGLLQDDVRQAASGFPGLSKIPVLGTLFRSRDYQRNESELVIIATPYLVRPVARKNIARPDDNFQPAADGPANFLGRLNRVYGKVEGQLPKGRYHGKVGFIFK